MTTAGLDDQQRLAAAGGPNETGIAPTTLAANKYHPATGFRTRGQQQSFTATPVSFHHQDKSNTPLQYNITPTTIRRTHLESPQDEINNANIKDLPEDQLNGVPISNERNNFYPKQGIDSEHGDKVTNGRHDDDDEGSSEEELMAVASAEEYAAKITKLQQACLIPLKEDLADWLNKILKTSNITSENFMHNLDNGVIICRLAKIISLWCEQRLADHVTGQTKYSTSTSSTNVSIISTHSRSAIS